MSHLQNKTLLVFTGGGLAPALNPTLYGVITAARKSGMKVLGGMYGWASLMRQGEVIDLTGLNIEVIKNIGGTFLRSSRTNPLMSEMGVAEIKEIIAGYNIDFILPIGGNDTLGAALKLFEDHGISLVGIPKTVDNDLGGTYWTPGFPSAAYYFANLAKEIRIDAAYALSRVFVMEAPGMHAGWLTASASFGGADVIVPPEKPIDLDNFLEITAKRYHHNGKFALVVVSQEANLGEELCGIADDQLDEFGVVRRKLICLSVRDEIKNKLGLEAKMLYPGNYVESGPPIDLDRDLAVRLGEKAIELLAEEKFGFMPNLVRSKWSSSKIEINSVNLKEAVGEDKYRVLDNSLFDFEELKVKQKFLDYLEPALGKPDWQGDYYKLIKQIN